MQLPTKEARSSKSKEHLDLSYASLTAVPSDLDRLHHLVTLRLDNNSLTTVPWAGLMKLPELIEVNLAHNLISELPVALAQWNKLKRLDVSHNRISALDPALFTLFFHPELMFRLRVAPSGEALELSLHESRQLTARFPHGVPDRFDHTFSRQFYDRPKYADYVRHPSSVCVSSASIHAWSWAGEH